MDTKSIKCICQEYGITKVKSVILGQAERLDELKMFFTGRTLQPTRALDIRFAMRR